MAILFIVFVAPPKIMFKCLSKDVLVTDIFCLQGLTSQDVHCVAPLVYPLLLLCVLGDQGVQIQVSYKLKIRVC